MEILWDHHNDLAFKIHMKPNQVLKYLNKDSCHTGNYFKAIPNGVLRILSKLTSKSNLNFNSKLDELYSNHAKAFQTANLAPPSFPTMKEVRDEVECESKIQIAKEKKKK